MLVNHSDQLDEKLALAAREAAALARELAPQTEHDRRLAPELVERLRASGLLRAGAPASVGAAQASPGVTLRCAETVARGDASAGWCVSIAATSSLLGGWLAPEGLNEVFGDPSKVAAGVWAPRGKARRVDGGYVVSGQWAFCSGIMHSDYLFGGCMVAGEPGGPPTPMVLGLRVDELEILDTWHTSGLRGTASHDAVAEEVFVPERRSLWLLDPPASPAALYRFPIFAYFALSISAAALGNARGAIDDLQALAMGKVSLGSSRTLAERPATWSAVAQAEASLRAARAFYYQAIEDAWAAAVASDTEPVPRRAQGRPAARRHARGADSGGRRRRHVRPRRRLGDLRRFAAAAPLSGCSRGHGPLPGQRRHLGADRAPAARAADRRDDAVSAELGVTIPFWLDRPDEEAIEIARAAEHAGLERVWVGEMASFDAFALAAAIGQQTDRIGLTIGPLAVGVRSPWRSRSASPRWRFSAGEASMSHSARPVR